MLCCRIFSVLMASLSISLLLMALSTDYWKVSFAPAGTSHSGLWQYCMNTGLAESYIIATRVFLIMASLVALALLFFLIATFMPSVCGILGKPWIASVAAFVAGFFILIALAVYTAETWKEKTSPEIQVSYEWSFYLGWITFPLFILAGESRAVFLKLHHFNP
uniref:Natural killer cell granule protein 7 n=1 Tax=Pseudonaja textilis TaxID=8673 RepID=A0A670ZFS0_PSETE